MKRVLSLFVAMGIALYLSGCGGGGSEPSATSNQVGGGVSVKSLNFESTDTSGSITLGFTTVVPNTLSLSIDSIGLTSDKYDISVLSVLPSTLTFDTSGQKSMSVSFSYTPKSSSVTGPIKLEDMKLTFKETYRSKLSNSETSKTTTINTISASGNGGSSSGGGDGGGTTPIFGYHLDSVSKKISVTKTGSSYQIEVALYYVDQFDNRTPVVDGNVIANFIQPIHGKMVSYSQTTDSSGIATFTYVSPKRIEDANATTLKFYWDQDPTVSLNIDLSFDIQSDKQVYDLYLEPSNFVISGPGQTKDIRIVTVNSKNVGIPTSIQVEQLANGDGNSYGSFDKSSTFDTDDSGVAVLRYTAPETIPNSTSREIAISSTDTSGNAVVKRLRIDFQTANETNATTYDIDIVSQNALEVNGSGSFTVNIFKEGNPDEIILNNYVNEVNVTTTFTDMIEINGSNKATYSNSGTKVIPVTTSTISGTVLVDISANIYDGEKNITITKRVPLVILSGPVSALSLVYVHTIYDKEKGLFEDRWNIHAVDKYANPAREGISLYPTLINGYKHIGYAAGSIVASDPANFTDTSAPFGAVDVNPPYNDRLIIMPQSIPEKIDKSYLGDWTISRVVDSSTLELEDIYAGPDDSQLKYIIGSEKRALADVISIADIKSAEPSGTYKTDANGNVRFDVTYDPMLVGHTLTLSAKTYNGTVRSGTAIRTSFRGEGYSVNSKKIDNDGNTHVVTLSISINPNGEPLVGVELVPDSITTDSGQCTLNPASVPIRTNNNGSFTVLIDTAGDINKAKECTISWEATNSSIYYEY